MLLPNGIWFSPAEAAGFIRSVVSKEGDVALDISSFVRND